MKHSGIRAGSSDGNWICLTPTRNENWIIRHFAGAAALWADHVIIADQGSDDGTVEFARTAPKVELVLNKSPKYDEAHRQRLLISHARKVGGRRILLALDADEALSANATTSAEWQKIEAAAPGTVLRFRWVNVLPDFKEAWIPANRIACGFIDDGSEHVGTKIHSTRIPTPAGAPVLDLHDIVVLHFQYIAWDRVVAKHRWYQAWEHASDPKKSALDIFRSYNHMYGSWKPDERVALDAKWLQGYQQNGIDYRAVQAERVTWWDREIVRMLAEHGASFFRKTAIWDRDWNEVARSIGITTGNFSDPRSALEKQIHRALARTQSHRHLWRVRLLEKAARTLGW